MHQGQRDELEGRRHHACRHLRHPAAEGRRLDGPERADQARGSRSLGSAIRREDRPGDIPLLYTGRWKRRAALGAWATPVSGYYPDTIPWMHERLPAFIGHDFNIDWNPRPGWEGMRNPIHVAVLNWMGINIVECLDLEEMIATARRLDRYEALITFAPLPVEGGTGSPVNPLVTF